MKKIPWKWTIGSFFVGYLFAMGRATVLQAGEMEKAGIFPFTKGTL